MLKEYQTGFRKGKRILYIHYKTDSRKETYAVVENFFFGYMDVENTFDNMLRQRFWEIMKEK